ncbi:MAG: response regulator [Desulfobacterales bacterium]|nr:response regulator [Desulfobacterales bacterium]
MKSKENVFLIVDDEPDMCWALEHILEKNGYPSKKALNGQEALKLVEGNRFQLAFLDAKLPDIEGLELARRIRELDPSIDIVIVSGYFYKDDVGIQHSLAEGLISSFISKPFNHDEILKTIESNLSS